MESLSQLKSKSSSYKRTWLKYCARIFWVVAGTYLLVLLALMAFENQLVYPGVPASQEWKALLDKNFHFEDVTLTTPNPGTVHAWWCPVPNPDYVVLYCHGNGYNLSFYQIGVRKWQKNANASVFIFDYPGYGKSQSGISEKACYQAGRAAYDWLVKKGIEKEKIVIYGESLGGGIATYLAEKNPSMGLVLVNTFTSLPEAAHDCYRIFPTDWIMKNRFENLSRLSDIHVPIVISHGTGDEIISHKHSQKLYAAANEPKLSILREDASHFTIEHPLPDSFYLQVHEFLRKARKK